MNDPPPPDVDMHIERNISSGVETIFQSTEGSVIRHCF